MESESHVVQEASATQNVKETKETLELTKTPESLKISESQEAKETAETEKTLEASENKDISEATKTLESLKLSETKEPTEEAKEPSEEAKMPSEGAKEPSEGAKEPSEGAKQPSEGVNESEEVSEAPRFILKKWTGVASWSYGPNVDTCAICRFKVMDLCCACQEKPDMDEEDDCGAAFGVCGHVFHMHCITKWVDKRSVCPLDNKEWQFQKLEN